MIKESDATQHSEHSKHLKIIRRQLIDLIIKIDAMEKTL